MAKKRRRGREQSSDGDESSSDESERGVDELDLEQLKGKLRRQPIEPWQGRDEEIHACEESTRNNKERKASEAISANGCCQCFTVHMCLAVFVVATAGVLLTAVGAGTAPGLTPANVFGKYQGVEECVALLSGDLIPVSKWSGDLDELCDFSREKMEARIEAAKELEPEPEPEQDPSDAEEGEFKCRKNCGRCFDNARSRHSHEISCTGPIEEDEEAVAETDAALAFLKGWKLRQKETVDAAAIGGVDGVYDKPGNADRLLEKVHSEVKGLEGQALASKLSDVGADVIADAPPEQRRAAYCLARVKKLFKPVLLARKYFWENGEFQRPLCQAYVRGIKKGAEQSRNKRLRKMIKGVSGTPAPGGQSDDALEAALVKAYEDKTPEVAEASNNPFAAPKIAAVIADHGEKLRGRADDDAVLKAVAKTATGLLQQTKGGFMATNGSVVYVYTAWLIRLILDGRTVGRDDSIFERFKADDEGKREGYFEADGWLSAAGHEVERVPYNHLDKYDEARDTLGEVVFGGNGTNGRTVVCFIVEGRKYFVLFEGREDFVLVNEVTMDCLAFVAATVVPIVLAETSSRSTDANYGALSSDELPRLKDILASVLGEQENRRGFRGKWNAMTGFFDGFYARVLKAILHKGGTITEAPGRLSEVAGGVPKQGPKGSADGPEDGWHFDEGQIENFVLRLRGGGSGMCGGGGGGGGGGDSDDDGGAAPTGSGPSGRGRAKRPKYDPFEGLDPWTPWNPNQVLVGVDGPGDGSGAG